MEEWLRSSFLFKKSALNYDISLANGEITLVQPCKILQDIDSHYIQCLSKIFPEKCVSQLWKSYFVLTHKMSEIIKLKSRKISDKNPKFYSVICASQRPTISWVLSEILRDIDIKRDPRYFSEKEEQSRTTFKILQHENDRKILKFCPRFAVS